MNRRTRKFIGTLAMLIFVIVYALVVMVLAQPILTDASKLTQGLFYFIAGLGWILPLMPLIRWMERPEAPRA